MEKRYRFGLSKVHAWIAITLMFLMTVFFIVIYFNTTQYFLLGLALLSTGMGFGLIYQQRNLKELILTSNELVVPYGFLNKKSRVIKRDKIYEVSEVSINHVDHIRVLIKDDKQLLIQSSLLQENDYYELLEILENTAHSEIRQLLSPTTVEQAKRKRKILSLIALSMPVLFFIASQVVSDEWVDLDGWIKFLSFVTIGILISFFAEKALNSKSKGDSTKYSRKEIKKIKSRWSLFACLPIFFGFILVFVALMFPYEGHSTIYPFIPYSILIGAGILYIFDKVISPPEAIVSRNEKLFYNFFSLITLTIGLTSIQMNLNRNLDNSIGKERESHLTDEFIPKDRSARCYRIAHWDTGEGINTGDSAFCSDHFPRIEDKDKVKFLLREGFFGVPWMDKISFKRLKDFPRFIEAMGGDINLKFTDLEYWKKRMSAKEFEGFANKWKDKCKAGEPIYCRLEANSYILNDDKERALKLFKIACDQKEFFSCYSLVYLNYADKKYMIEITKQMLSECKHNKNDHKVEICNFMKSYDPFKP